MDHVEAKGQVMKILSVARSRGLVYEALCKVWHGWILCQIAEVAKVRKEEIRLHALLELQAELIAGRRSLV